MKPDILLNTALAKRLFYECAAGQPIIDFHSHLSVVKLAADRLFETLTELWITYDPYKHRAMRITGVPEALITGSAASPRERFDAWAATVPKTVGNPLWHWSALELERAFGIREPLSPQSADRIWDEANAKLQTQAFSARNLLSRFNVVCVCTSDGLLDDLGSHRRLAASGYPVRVLPSLRGDEIVSLERSWLERLGDMTGLTIHSFEAFCEAVKLRLDAFDALGCRLADHALDAFKYVPVKETAVANLFARRLLSKTVPESEALKLRSAILHFLGCEYARRGWVMQLHLGAQRRTSSRLRLLVGPAGGYAAPGSACQVDSLCRFLDDIEFGGLLPRTILYTLNPADNAVLATLTGSFTQDGVAGKVQFGPAWWYNDHALGIRQHLETLANYGLLSTFIGMTTDSRSLLSMARHEYFRRVLCDTLGEWAGRGVVPDDFDVLEPLVRAVTCGNAQEMVLGKR